MEMVVRNINLQVLYRQTDFSGTAVLGWARARQEALVLFAEFNLQSPCIESTGI